MIRVLTLIGTRPEAIKMAPVVAEFERHRDSVRSVVCVTGQHREMLDQAMAVFDLTADYDLDLMRPDQSLSQLTARLLEGLDGSGGIQEEALSLGVPVLVMRDTTERSEGVAAGFARLVGTKREPIVMAAIRLLRNPAEYRKMVASGNPYGDGRAASRIVAALLERGRR